MAYLDEKTMKWISPVPFQLVETDDPESFASMAEGTTGLPTGDHPGAFGFRRQHHTHEGVDLYVPVGTPVVSVEPGVVVAIVPFTGEHATPPSPWWHNTWAVLVEGQSGVVCYGEIIPSHQNGAPADAGELLGHVAKVLTKDKGRPTTMLHLELYKHGVREPVEWLPYHDRPEGLLDPTPLLLTCLT